MPRIKGSNGLAIPVSDDIAASLLRHPEGEFEVVEHRPAPAKKAAPKPPSK